MAQTPRTSSAAIPRKSAGFRSRHPRLMRWLYITTTFVVAFAGGSAYGAWALVCRAGQCPAVEELESYQPRQTSKLYAADGRFIAELGLERRTLIKLSEIPPVARDAFVVIEDKRFYKHGGLDWYRVPGAVFNVIRTRSFSQGFSTITMQL